VNGITSSTALWYASRATGIIALLMLTAVVLLGVAVRRQSRLPGLPRYGVIGLHRSVSLLSVVFLAIHVITAVSDPYVTLRLTDAVLPFAASYKPLWIGLGAVSFDLMAAVIVTSLLRVRLGRPIWRAVHWLAYVSWPVAIAHSIGSSDDMQSGWLLGLAVGCIVAVAGAVVWRIAGDARTAPRPIRVSNVFTQLRRHESVRVGGR
jgi:predicted ferric reductase